MRRDVPMDASICRHCGQKPHGGSKAFRSVASWGWGGSVPRKDRGRRDRHCAVVWPARAAGLAGLSGPRASAGRLQRVEQPQGGAGGAHAGDGPLQRRPAPRLPLRASAGVLQAPRRPRPLARLQLQVRPRGTYGAAHRGKPAPEPSGPRPFGGPLMADGFHFDTTTQEQKVRALASPRR